MPNRLELVTAIEALLHEQCGHGPSSALVALDALGFTAGLIFSQAPDWQCHDSARQQFCDALNAGLGGERLVDRMQLN